MTGAREAGANAPVGNQPAAAVGAGVDERAMFEKALRRAFSMGQTYWQQADSESYSQNRKSVETIRKFGDFIDETLAALAPPAAAAWEASPDERGPRYKIMEIAAELAQRKPIAAFCHLEDNTHIGHRQFRGAFDMADEACRLLAIRLRDALDALSASPTQAPKE